MLKYALMASGMAAAFAGAAVAQTSRSADAHVHGSGSVSIAIDGAALELMVETPAYNVLGFEYTAQTPEDKQLVAAVRSLLENPQALFTLPTASGCTLQNADVEIGPEGHGDHDHGDHGHGHGDGHSDIAARYRYTCTSPSAIDRIGFAWFEAFPLSEKLDVVALSDRGQFSGQTTPRAPDFRLR